MKKSILIIWTVCLASTLLGANEKYYQKMGETLGKFGSAATIEDYQALANSFRNIANVETGEWLPLYYEAQCYILLSFMDNSGSEGKDKYLDQSKSSIDKMLELAPEESEAYALKAFYYTGKLVVNPPERAQTTSPLIGQNIGRALAIDPVNPRALYIQLTNEIGTARFFGSDTEPYCAKAIDLLNQWDSYTLRSAIHPGWGKNQLQEIVNSCGK